jgi:CheY-like chemotaxis protein
MDPVQLEQVLLNLAINAGDAMPDGGTLTLATSEVEVHAEQPLAGLAPGRYGKLSVRDTGVGMDAATLEHLFEPFFTTKERDRGTGLGLATVYGIVEQSGGSVEVSSQLGRGAIFDVYLPSARPGSRSPSKAPSTAPSRLSRRAPRDDVRVFLVEDDPLVRQLAQRALAQAGYRVESAGSAEEAVERLAALSGGMDALVTDIVMPGQGGLHVAERFRQRFADIPVLFMSGYADEIVARQGVERRRSGFLAKPFTPVALVTALGDALRLAAEEALEATDGGADAHGKKE